jgi:hypothetical protein
VVAHEPDFPPGEHCRSRSSKQVFQATCFRPRWEVPAQSGVVQRDVSA